MPENEQYSCEDRFIFAGSRCFHILADIVKLFAVTRLTKNTYTNGEQKLFAVHFLLRK